MDCNDQTREDSVMAYLKKISIQDEEKNPWEILMKRLDERENDNKDLRRILNRCLVEREEFKWLLEKAEADKDELRKLLKDIHGVLLAVNPAPVDGDNPYHAELSRANHRSIQQAMYLAMHLANLFNRKGRHEPPSSTHEMLND